MTTAPPSYNDITSDRASLISNVSNASERVSHFFGVHREGSWRGSGVYRSKCRCQSRSAIEDQPYSVEADEKPALAVVRELEGESSRYGTVDYVNGPPRRSRYKPWGIPLITFIQFIVLVWELSSAVGIVPIGLVAVETREPVPVFTNKQRRPQVIMDVDVEANILIGPDTKFLIQHGAKFVPCMRPDLEYERKKMEQKKQEESDVCCAVIHYQACGMLNKTRCLSKDVTGIVLGGMTSFCNTSQSLFCSNVELRPCCSDIYGACNITSELYCKYSSGIWAKDLEPGLCGASSCLSKVCGSTSSMEGRPNEWWRVITALFLSGGFISFLMISSVQLYLGIRLEREAGTVRVVLLYFISGIGGYIVSSALVPRSPAVGANGAVMGLLGCVLLELLQYRTVMVDFWKELSKLGFIVALFFSIGLLPNVDNWCNIGGLVFGIPVAIIFMPYLSFTVEEGEDRRRSIMLYVMIPSLFILSLLAVIFFYNSTECYWCYWLNCLTYKTSAKICQYHRPDGYKPPPALDI